MGSGVWTPANSTEPLTAGGQRPPLAGRAAGPVDDIARRTGDTCHMLSSIRTNDVPRGITLPASPAQSGANPSWFEQRLALEDRPWTSYTGDVNWVAGRTFQTRFDQLPAAVEHARSASDGAAGAVAVMEHSDHFYLARSYNAEKSGFGLEMRQTQLDGPERLSQLHPDLRVVVDGLRQVAPRR